MTCVFTSEFFIQTYLILCLRGCVVSRLMFCKKIILILLKKILTKILVNQSFTVEVLLNYKLFMNAGIYRYMTNSTEDVYFFNTTEKRTTGFCLMLVFPKSFNEYSFLSYFLRVDTLSKILRLIILIHIYIGC